jgi:hypothetical protein
MFLDLFEQVRRVERALVPRRSVTKITLAGEAEDVAEFDRRFAGRELYHERIPVGMIPGFERLSFIVCDFLNGRCRGKAEAIHFLEAERGIPAEAVIAIGDHLNDLTMIRAAGLGVAMGNAPDEVKRAARLVIGRHDEDGVARFVEGLLEG